MKRKEIKRASPSEIKIACLQTNATDCFEDNLHQSFKLAHLASAEGADLICYPELFLFRGSQSQSARAAKHMTDSIHKFQQIACISRVAIVLGSILEKSHRRGRFYNTTLFISDQGKILAQYRKIHLFDVTTPEKHHLHESRYTVAGTRPVTVEWKGLVLGFAICYDLRFPELFRKLSELGAQLVFVPSNFLRETGKAHWHALLRSRAIENLMYVAAPAQAGANPYTKISSYGHSLIVSPWGKILAEASGGRKEVITAMVNSDTIASLRDSFPVLKHSKLR